MKFKYLVALGLLLFSTSAFAMRTAPNVLVLSAGDMSQATLTSAVIPMDQVLNVAVQAVYTGSPNGSIAILGSVDNITYTQIDSQTISAAGNYLWNFPNVGYGYMKAVYTKTSGTGSLTVRSYSKGY